MNIKELKQFLEAAETALQEKIDNHDTQGVLEGRDELMNLIGQLQAIQYIKKLLK